MKKILGAIALVEAMLFLADPVMATLLDQHAYTLYRTSANIPLHGLSFTSQNTGEDLQNLNAPPSFITKEGWLVFSDSNGGEWIETGTVNGALYRSFTDHTTDHWDGFYVATNGCNGVTASQCSYQINYNEGEVGSQAVTGKHNFIIRKMTDSSGNYQVYIDYMPIIKFNSSTFTVPNPIRADIGFESNDTTNSFTSGTVIYDFWIVDPNNENNPSTAGWYPVTSSMAYIDTMSNYNGANIKVQYPYNNGTQIPAGAVTQSNKITFAHN